MSDNKTSSEFEQVPVAASARRSFLSMFVIMTGYTFFSASMWVGCKMANGLTFLQFVMAVLLGNLVLGAYCATLAYVAAKTGFSIHLLARSAFGRFGSFLPSGVLAFTQIGWFGVGVAMFAIPSTLLLKDISCLQGTWLLSGSMLEISTGLVLPLRCLLAITLISGFLMTSSAYFGIRALHVVSLVAVPSIAVLGGWSAIRALATNNGLHALVSHVPTYTGEMSTVIGLLTATSLAIGSFISGGTCTPDFVRFAKTPRQAVITTIIAFFLGNSLMFFFGAIASMVYGKQDISEVMQVQGLLIPAILVLGLNIWTTNDNALYTSGLGLANITNLPKRHLVLAAGFFGTISAIWLYSNFCNWLNILNVFIPPCGAIVLISYLFNGCDRRPKAFSWAALVGFSVGSFVALCGFGYIPFLDMTGIGLPAINGMFAAAATYSVIDILAGGTSDR